MDRGLRDGDVVLAPLSAEYERFYIDLANNPAVRERVNNSIPYLKEHFDELLLTRTGHQYVWIILQGSDARGAITFGQLKSHPQIFQGGYWLEPSAWGQGLASRSLNLVCDFLLKHADAVRIQAVVEPDNTVSMRVLEKCGFRHEGLLRKFYPSRYRGLLDVHMYARTA